jgi:hypothetical protein
VNVGRERKKNKKVRRWKGERKEGRKAGKVANPNHNGVSIEKRQTL